MFESQGEEKERDLQQCVTETDQKIIVIKCNMMQSDEQRSLHYEGSCQNGCSFLFCHTLFCKPLSFPRLGAQTRYSSSCKRKRFVWKKIDLHCQSRKTANVIASASLILSQLPIVINRPVFLAFVVEYATKL